MERENFISLSFLGDSLTNAVETPSKGKDEILGIWEFGNPEISHLFKPNLTYPNLT